jgi:small-conductance mechanosensitive channel
MTWNDLFQQFLNAILNLIPSVIASMVVFLVSLFLAAWLAKLVRKALEQREVWRELVILLSRLTRWSVMIIGGIWALQVVGFNVSAFVAGLGVTGLIIGFALQDISKNFTSGALLMIQEPFSLGDYIEVAGNEGEVMDIQMRATELLSPDGLRVLIPNADVFTNTIINYTKTSRRRVKLTIGVAYDSDLQKVTETALQAIRAVPGLLNDPAPMLFFHDFSDSAIDFTIRYWFDTTETNYFAAQDIGVKAIKQAFDRESIEIPYPIRTIMMSGPSAPSPGY